MSFTKKWISCSNAQISWGLWGAYALAIVLLKFSTEPSYGNVCSVYFRAGERLLAEIPLYPGKFLYFPTAAFFFTPFTVLPFPIGASIWRLLNLGVFIVGIYNLTKIERTDRKKVEFLLVTVVVCLLSSSAAKHGQATLMMAGLLMLAAVDLERSKPWRASFFMALALALKPTALPFLMLAVVGYPASRFKMTALVPILFSLPFLLRDPSYILEQYLEVPRMLQETSSWEYRFIWASFMGLLQTLGVNLDQLERLITRGLFAAAAFVAYITGKERLPETADRCLYLYAIAAGYVLLMSPLTERNTYAMLAPVVGTMWCLARNQEGRGIRLLLGLVVLANLLSHSMAKVFPGSPLSMLKPIGAVVVITILIWETFSKSNVVEKKDGTDL
ncbi:MAG: DUF2029 domain-containing protein [Desulfobacterales bacterium]|nr:MAG: DUF2029 domain-containing protein [Desulfobacterales bacterium]